MRILFMGTPKESASVLETLIEAKHEIILVVTQPDRPKGRGLKITPSKVKELALKHGLPLEQPEDVKDSTFIKILGSFKPDLIVLVAYGKIIPKEILSIPEYGCINVHASLLPKYRGAAPIQWALMNGEKETGVTIFKLDEGLDTGAILLQEKIKIEDSDNAATLSEKLFRLGGELLLKAIKLIEDGKALYVPQALQESYAPSITVESGNIDFKKSAEEIHNRIRALNPWPGAYTFYKGKRLKMLSSETKIANLVTKAYPPGTVIEIVKNIGFIIESGRGHILIKEVKPEGGKKIRAYDFVIGHKVRINEVLPS